jgi:hypothetical protein
VPISCVNVIKVHNVSKSEVNVDICPLYVACCMLLQVLEVHWRGTHLWGTIEVLPTPSGLLLWELYAQVGPLATPTLH